MLKSLLKSIFNKFGFDVRRKPDPSLPFIEMIEFDGKKIQFWVATLEAKHWLGSPILRMNAEFRSIKSMCAPGSIVFDVGAHHVFFTVPLALWTGTNGYVYAFEANAKNALVLHANVALNQLQNCTCLHTAVAAKTGEIRVAGHHISSSDSNARLTHAVSLDDYWAKVASQRVDLIKIDVEGYEGQVLKGARNLLSTRPNIAIEIHLDYLGDYGSSVAEILNILDIQNYEVQMMVRHIDWETLTPFKSADDLPAFGVVNLFLRALHR